MRPVVVERTLECRAAPEALWCFITDTERLNRAIGLHRIELEPLRDDSAARYLVSTVSGGFPLEYEERPYEWVENERFTIRRPVRKGAVHYMENSFTLKPRAGGGTELGIRLEVGLKFRVLAPIVRSQLRRFAERIAQEVSAIDADLHGGKDAGFTLGGPRLHESAFERARVSLLERVTDEQRAAAERLVETIVEGADPAVDRLRPFELAERWESDRRETLGACLHAVLAGMLELRWDVVCPSCRTAADRLGSLADLESHGHCQLCDISFDIDLDRAVEATFRPAPAVRTLDEGPYCIGGPARTPHVIAQAIVPADGAVTLRAPSTVGMYRLFVRGGARARLEVREEGEKKARVVVADEIDDIVLRPGGELEVVQQGGSERHVKVERLEWHARAATAAIVSTLPEFRRLFSSDVLRPGVSLKTGRVALMFTDLTQSTALYRAMGDAKAFQLVHDHFDLLHRVVAEHQGTVVKTMGDAVMAAFVDDLHAVRAALTLHDELRGFRAGRDGFEECFLKVGIFAGPCYCVTANGILDYFGQTVNVAARLQQEARGGELVVATETLEALQRAGVLPRDAAIEAFEPDLKGVGRVQAARVTVDSQIHTPDGEDGSRSRHDAPDVAEAPSTR
ncbi:MAG TPA: adenylate/guanylate cyclase domain-containing protein [Polyangiaceae bacterium]|jgi:class 3 adenylate cyclase|nr:adenylate/guanylate cyclase domain-containing protein [Polyangiaceae bacterium]